MNNDFSDLECEFCKEFIDFELSRVGKIYKDYDSRIIYETDDFIVIPTVGQIVPGSLLLLTKQHYETFAELPKSFQNQLGDVMASVQDHMKVKTVLFEHGARKKTNASCGVFHAHIHFVPIDNLKNIGDLIGNKSVQFESIEEAYKYLENSDNYIFFQDSEQNIFVNTVSNGESELFTSQHFRKWLVKNYHPEKEWDWKKYNFVESDLVTTLDKDKEYAH